MPDPEIFRQLQRDGDTAGTKRLFLRPCVQDQDGRGVGKNRAGPVIPVTVGKSSDFKLFRAVQKKSGQKKQQNRQDGSHMRLLV